MFNLETVHQFDIPPKLVLDSNSILTASGTCTYLTLRPCTNRFSKKNSFPCGSQ